MTQDKIQTVTGLSVVALTRFLMDQLQLTQDKAYEKLLSMDIYALLLDSETGLYLETNDYLRHCCAVELNEGKDALYALIND